MLITPVFLSTIKTSSLAGLFIDTCFEISISIEFEFIFVPSPDVNICGKSFDISNLPFVSTIKFLDWPVYWFILNPFPNNKFKYGNPDETLWTSITEEYEDWLMDYTQSQICICVGLDEYIYYLKYIRYLTYFFLSLLFYILFVLFLWLILMLIITSVITFITWTVTHILD